MPKNKGRQFSREPAAFTRLRTKEGKVSHTV